MKYLLSLLIFNITMVCTAQINPESFIGTWEYQHTTNYQDSIIDSPIENFEFFIYRDSIFEMIGDRDSVSGSWQLSDSTLIISGEANRRRRMRPQELKIYTIKQDKLVFEVALEHQKQALMHLKRQ